MKLNSLKKWHNVIQGSDEWHELRRGKTTSSNFAKVYANYGKAFGNPAKQYAQKKALERVTGLIDPNGFSNKNMERGNELEPIARDLYEIETFYKVSNGGFYEFGFLGDSNDGNVGDKGCIEIKCVIANTHWERIKKGGYDLKYKTQIQGHLLIGEKEWCDFISYCPEFPKEKQLYIHRVYKDDEMQEQLVERLTDFEKLIVNNVNVLNR